MSLHIECSTATRDHFGRLLSSIEAADGLIASQTLAANEISEPLPGGGGLIVTLTAMVDLWVAIGPDPDPSQAPRRWLRAGIARSFEASGGLRIAWCGAEPDTPPVSRRKTRPVAEAPA
jgi:hypothetical protein